MLRKIASISILALLGTSPSWAETNCESPWTSSATELSALDSEKRAAEIQRLMDCARRATEETQNRLGTMTSIGFDKLINDLIDERAALQKLYDDRKAAIGQLENDLLARIQERDDALQKLRTSQTQLTEAQDKLATLTAEREKLNAIIADNSLKIQELQQEIDNGDAERAELDDRNEALSKEIGEKDKIIDDLKANLGEKSAALAKVENDLKELRNRIASLEADLADRETKLSTMTSLQKETEARLGEALAKIGTMNGDVERLNARISELKAENEKLKSQVDALSGVRSEFFARLKEKLKDQPNIRIVGDRFIIQSEILFDVGSPDLNARGKADIVAVAHLLKELSPSFPSGIHWVMQVNGHTDVQKIAPGGKFASNWELSSARALTVVKLMQAEGVPPNHLVAAGFGEYQPVDSGSSRDSFAKNRRIELKLTDDGPYQ